MKFKVFYAKNPTFEVTSVTRKNIEDSHVYIKTVLAQDLEDAYSKMQACIWSNNGEGMDIIKKAGARHTSMSIGDILVDEEGNGFQCNSVGWEVLY